MKASSKKIMTLNTVQCGTTRHIFDDASRAEVEAKIHRQMINGNAIYHEDGRREFFLDEAIVDLTAVGSGMYSWDKAGEKIKHKRFRIITTNDSTIISKTVERVVFKSWE